MAQCGDMRRSFRRYFTLLDRVASSGQDLQYIQLMVVAVIGVALARLSRISCIMVVQNYGTENVNKIIHSIQTV